MRAPLSWIRTYVEVPADQAGRDVAARLIAAGLAPRVACQVTLVQPLTDDAPTARALQDLVDLSF